MRPSAGCAAGVDATTAINATEAVRRRTDLPTFPPSYLRTFRPSTFLTFLPDLLFSTGAGALQPPLACVSASYGGRAEALAKAGTPSAFIR